MSSTFLNPDGPALHPPENVHTNFDAVGLGHIHIAVLVVYLTVSTALLTAYIYTRFCILKNPGSEDYTLLLSWAILIPFCAGTIRGHFAGFGKHQWDVRLRDIGDIIYWFNICTILYDFGFMMLKISIVTQYRRIFAPINRQTFIWWGSWLLTFLFFTFYLITAFLNIFICYPRQKLWQPSHPGRCLNNHAVRFSSAIFNAITDFVIILMPQLAIRKLHLPRRTQIGLALVFSIGIFASIASCVRIYYAHLLSQTEDISFVGAQFGLWCFAELGLGIICACLPILPRFLQSTLYQSMFYRQISTTLKKLLDTVAFWRSRTAQPFVDSERNTIGVLSGTSLETLNRPCGNQSWESANSRSPKSGMYEVHAGNARTAAIETRTGTSIEGGNSLSVYSSWQ